MKITVLSDIGFTPG